MADGGQVPFHLRGNYAPIDDELTLIDLPVVGAIPPALSGVYMRNGPNPKHGATAHWFFGDGMLHGLRLENGRAAWYRNRWVRTACFDGQSRLDPASFGDRRVTAANTHVVRHAGRLFALEEGAFPFEIDAQMQSIGPYDFSGALQTAFTAHPKICPETGEMHAFGYAFMPPWLTYHQIGADGRLQRSIEIPVKGPTMIHDFGMTRTHIVFMDLPIVFDLNLAMRGKNPFRWSDEYGARLGVMPRGGDAADVRWIEIEPCYVFHPANAYDDGDAIVMEVCRFESMWRGQATTFDSSSFLHQWRIDLKTMRVQERPLDEMVSEFPRIDDRRAGLRNRYVYSSGAAPRPGAVEFDHVLKFDRQTGARMHKAFPNAALSEFAFAPGGPGEDEGWLMGFVFDKTRAASDFVILDAQTMQETARVALPRRVPHGFHGNWFVDA